MGFLDRTKGYSDIGKFLDGQENLCDDLKALKRVCEKWNTKEPLDVGESGTLYRFLKFYFWKKGEEREFILRGSLKKRKICDNPSIINWPLENLKDKELDEGTSQWQSASVLSSFVFNEDIKIIENPDPKLQLTYDAVRQWKEKRDSGSGWNPRADSTIAKQAKAYVKFLETGEMKFEIQCSEEYPFARAFNLILPEEGQKRFPSLLGHESNRILEMENMLEEAKEYDSIGSKDHRVIQAVVMKYAAKRVQLDVKHKNAVNKSWPKFWDFMSYCQSIRKS